ncbi:MAG TPA: glycosyltransferase, partial [Gaiellaceae bacterium]|nr:glycosyltransferase [Gaiellaceae bacterium]
MTAAKPHVLVLNQYYWPGVEATAYLLAELCEALTDEFDVTVVTGMVPGLAEGGRERRNGVEIVRVGSTAFDRSRLSLRAVNYLTYLGLSFVEGLKMHRPDVVLCMTDPPVIADVALVLARRFRAPLVVVTQDVFPEVAVALNRLDNRALVLALRLATRAYLQRADRIVAIGERMRERLEE